MSPTNLKCSLKKSFTTYLMINLLLSPHGREGPQLSEWPWWWHATSISSAALLTAHWHRSTTPGFGNLGLINGTRRRRRLRQFWSSFSRSETVPAHRFPGCSASRWLLLVPLLVPLPVPIAQGQCKEFIQRELMLFIREEKLQMATSLLLTDPVDEQGAQHAQPGKSRSSVCIALKGQTHKSKGRRKVPRPELQNDPSSSRSPRFIAEGGWQRFHFCASASVPACGLPSFAYMTLPIYCYIQLTGESK